MQEISLCTNRTVDTAFIQYPADLNADIRQHNADIAAIIVTPIIFTLLAGLLCYMCEQIKCTKYTSV